MTAAALLIGSLLGCGLIAAVCSVAVAVGRVAAAINRAPRGREVP